MNEVKRGDLYYADLSPIIGSEQDGVRPVLVIQNDLGNATSNTTIVAAVTSRTKKKKMLTHVSIKAPCLPLKSVVLAEHLRTIDVQRLGKYIDHLDDKQMRKVDRALKHSLDLDCGIPVSGQKGCKHHDRKNDTLRAEKRTGSTDRNRSGEDSPDRQE